jgi:hypothetical protein
MSRRLCAIRCHWVVLNLQSSEVTEPCIPSHRKSSPFLATSNKAFSPLNSTAESANETYNEESIEFTQPLDTHGPMKRGSKRLDDPGSFNTLG